MAYMVNYGPWHYSSMIENEEGWMDFVRNQAQQNNQSVDDALLSNALYAFRQDFPGYYELNRGLTAMEEWIFSDAPVYNSLVQEADSLGFDPEQYIHLKAWQWYRDEEINRSITAIRSDPAWLKDVSEKAAAKGISVDEMIRLDAEYMWRMKINGR